MSIFLSGIVYALLFYIHEFGHILFGMFGNFITQGKISSITNISFINLPIPFPNLIIFSIPVPISVVITPDPDPFWIALAGIISVSFVTSIVGYYLYKKANKKEKKLIIILVVFVIIYEIVSNFLCGTDNFSHSYYPMPYSSEIVMIFQYILPAMFLAISISFLYCYYQKILNNSSGI
jgi:hypothetical protein